jgi:hypothetical protein
VVKGLGGVCRRQTLATVKARETPGAVRRWRGSGGGLVGDVVVVVARRGSGRGCRGG